MYSEVPSTEFLVIFGVSFFMLMLVRVTMPGYLQELIQALWHPNFTQLLKSERKLGLSAVQLLLDTIFIVSAALVWMLILEENDFTSFMKLSVITGSFYISRLLLIAGAGRLFFGSSLSSEHQGEVILFNRIFGFIFLILTFILFYLQQPEAAKYLVIIIQYIIIICFIWRFMRIFQRIRDVRGHSYFYIFLYLCAIEISPFAILIKVLTLP